MSVTPTPSAAAALMGELGSAAGQADPYAVYERIRALGETVAGPDDSLIITGYRQCSALLREPRLRKNPGRLLTVSGFPDWRERPALKLMFESILMINPPDHTRLRGLVAAVFTHRRVAGMRPAVEKIADELLDRLEDSGDFVETVAFPFPVTVIGELLGVPAQERLQFKALVDEWTAVLEILNAPAVDRADEAATKIIDYFQQLVELRRADPRDDLISALVAAEAEDEHTATDEELVRLAALILGAGFETTTGLLANGLVALLEHPAQVDRWRRTPELSRAAVEELLRYDSPVQITYGRTAVDDIEVGGTPLHAGQRIITILGAANRDPDVFTDPNALVLDRDEGIPLSFGAGIHHCLGAALARLEGQVMFPRLLTRFPDIALDGEPRHRPSATLRGYASLPVSTG
ncbi:MAG TPA: cytochrome P450 [Solirubrobacteraceae bacterium]